MLKIVFQLIVFFMTFCLQIDSKLIENKNKINKMCLKDILVEFYLQKAS
jgi:hypothetical protein